MYLSKFPIYTLKESPADAEIISHKLMMRAGLIRRIAAGIYTWMPVGLRVLRKIEAIVREEMDDAGALELLMPTIQPADFWEKSGRWEEYDDELLRLSDRHERPFCYGPTHEEVICHHASQELRSYKQLPVNYYQIQTKFRDETRPRFGVMRSREFIMKDAYSFNADQESLEETYQLMRDTYQRIFDRLGVDYRIVTADGGSIGGSRSEEFHVLAQSGEDLLAVSEGGQWAANIEAATTAPSSQKRPAASAEMQQVATPNTGSIQSVCELLDVDATQTVKTIVVNGSDDSPVALVLRGDHEINPIKAAKHPLVAEPFALIDDANLRLTVQCGPGSVGPVGLNIPVITDHAAVPLADFICGANIDDAHYSGVNWGRDLPEPVPADLRNVTEGDASPAGDGDIKFYRGIEVGHIFQLGDKYTQSMEVSVQGLDGKALTPQMGCYGIGVTRIAGAIIEQCHDDSGIIWPEAVAPFQAVIVPINYDRSERTQAACIELYDAMKAAGIDVALDDRKLRPGVLFAEADLLGIPHRIVIGERGLDAGEVEYKHRNDESARKITWSVNAVIDTVTRACSH